MESFEALVFHSFHDLAARNLFKILIPTLDCLYASTSCNLGMFDVYLDENVTLNWCEL